MERLSIAHSRRASIDVADLFPAVEARMSSKGRQSLDSRNLRESVLELHHSQQLSLAQEYSSKGRRQSRNDHDLFLFKLTERINTSFVEKLNHPCILSEVAWAFRERVPKSKNSKNSIEYLDCFTGTVAVVNLNLLKLGYN